MTPAVRLIVCCIALMCSCAHVSMKTASSPFFVPKVSQHPLLRHTLLTLLMFPVLLLMYGRLAVTEENEMRKQFGATYDAYAQPIPRFIPRMGKAQSTTDSVSKR